MDALSDVRRVVRLTGAIFFDVCASDPRVADTPASAIVGRIFPDADHPISFHVVTRGACWGGVAGEPLLALDVGDVLVFPHGDPHLLASGPDMRVQPDLALYRRLSDTDRPFTISMGWAPGATGLVCGFLGCDARRVGYESEWSFSRAFEKVVGVAPGAWRAARRTQPPATGVR